MSRLSFLLLGVIALSMSASAQYGGSHGGYEDHEEHKDYYAPPHYTYEYKVHDSHTGDVKSAHETREGDVVKGFYSLAEADGTIREVHYTADHKNGFNAEVKKIGHAHHAPAPKQHAPSQHGYQF
ncbi:Cuticular protein [Nesidiocoris tenuis]|uniref:Cuticular protein n=1 Tax=Nesidiocoris tenuis TaxID=355587 RepID=A0ABN7B8L8_9HEMI|nr:Cuticular protein [Nesidiocoris tenuis]